MGQMRSGSKTVTTAGTAERLVANSTPCTWVRIQCNEGNAGDIAIGDSSVIAAVATRIGTAVQKTLKAGLQLPECDLTDIWIDAINSADQANFSYMEP